MGRLSAGGGRGKLNRKTPPSLGYMARQEPCVKLKRPKLNSNCGPSRGWVSQVGIFRMRYFLKITTLRLFLGSRAVEFCYIFLFCFTVNILGLALSI